MNASNKILGTLGFLALLGMTGCDRLGRDSEIVTRERTTVERNDAGPAALQSAGKRDDSGDVYAVTKGEWKKVLRTIHRHDRVLFGSAPRRDGSGGSVGLVRQVEHTAKETNTVLSFADLIRIRQEQAAEKAAGGEIQVRVQHSRKDRVEKE